MCTLSVRAALQCHYLNALPINFRHISTGTFTNQRAPCAKNRRALCAEPTAVTRRHCVTMFERVCRTLYALAELLCVIGLLALCVLKVQHFVSDPVSTAVSYQPSRPPAITVCHQLADEQAVRQLEYEFWDESLDLYVYSWRTREVLKEAKEAVSSYQRNLLDEDNSEVVTSDSDRNDLLKNITKNMLERTINQTEEIYQAQLRSDHAYGYSVMNETRSRLDDVLRESVNAMQQILETDQLSDLLALNITMETLDRLVNITKEMEARLDAGEWNYPSPARLLVEGTRRVDQFVISCRRGNVNCMPGEGGVWQLRHVLETKEKCYTLETPEEEIISEGETVVIELRGNRWSERTPDENPDSTTLSQDIDSTTSGDEAGSVTTVYTEREAVTDTTTENAAEAPPRPPSGTVTDRNTESAVTEGDSEVTQEPTFYPTVDNEGIPTPPRPDNVTDDGRPILIFPELTTNIEGFAPPSFVTSLNSFRGAPDAIQYVVYKVLLHAAPFPLLNAYGGLRERSFEIFNNQDWVEVDVRMEELRSLNRKSRPCEEDPAYSRGSCLSECHAAAHARAAGCQLDTVWPATAQGLPQCETAAQLERLRAELTESPSCACPRPCHQGRVSAVVQASSRTASDHNVTVLVRLDGDMQVIEESVAYTAGSLLTDFGGNMGLTMGFSLLTIVELLKKITFGFLEKNQVQKISEGKSDTWADSIA